MLKGFWQLIGALSCRLISVLVFKRSIRLPKGSLSSHTSSASKLIVGQTGVVFRYLLVFTLSTLRINAQDESFGDSLPIQVMDDVP